MTTGDAATTNEGKPADGADTQAVAAQAGAQQQAGGGEQAAHAQQPGGSSPAVPDKYEFKVPEGFTLDEGAAAEFSSVAKELKLTQDQAQKLADVHAKAVQRQVEAHAKLVQQWVEQVKTDPEIGGDKFDASLAAARKVLGQFGDDALRNDLNATGLGNHPGLIRLLARVGKAISEDSVVFGRAGEGRVTDPADILYGKKG